MFGPPPCPAHTRAKRSFSGALLYHFQCSRPARNPRAGPPTPLIVKSSSIPDIASSLLPPSRPTPRFDTFCASRPPSLGYICPPASLPFYITPHYRLHPSSLPFYTPPPPHYPVPSSLLALLHPPSLPCYILPACPATSSLFAFLHPRSLPCYILPV